MSFYEQIIATFVGSLSGFIFSIFLFYLTEKWSKSGTIKEVISNVQKELDFNIEFLSSYLSDIEKLLRAVTTNDKGTTAIFRHQKLQRLFILHAFNQGLLYKFFDVDDINNIDSMLTYFSVEVDNILYRTLYGYKEDTINQQDTLRGFEYDKKQIEKYIKILKELKKKLQA